MEVIFLGTGTGVPSMHRASPGLAVAAGGVNYLIDGGSGALRQLNAAGLDYNGLDVILYTHFHPDHFADFVPYLFATRYFAGFTRLNPARIFAPKGLFEKYNHLRAAFGHWIEPPEGKVIMEELPLKTRTVLELAGVKVEAGPIPHTPQSLGYRFTDQHSGTSIAVTGDTDYGPDLIKLAADADLMITECSFPDDMKREGHLTPSFAGRAAREANVKKLVLTHFYPEVIGREILGSVRKEFKGDVVLAEDLMRIEI